MARAAILSSSGVLASFALGDNSVMAGVAATCNRRMAHRYVGEAGRTSVTAFADIGGLAVRDVLAGCRGAVVAGEAIGGNPGVRKGRRQPGGGAVAAAAFRRRGDMGARLARRDTVVVTAGAGAQHLGVIHPDRRPGCRHMAEIATVGGADVRRRLTRRPGAVVA